MRACIGRAWGHLAGASIFASSVCSAATLRRSALFCFSKKFSFFQIYFFSGATWRRLALFCFSNLFFYFADFLTFLIFDRFDNLYLDVIDTCC